MGYFMHTNWTAVHINEKKTLFGCLNFTPRIEVIFQKVLGKIEKEGRTPAELRKVNVSELHSEEPATRFEGVLTFCVADGAMETRKPIAVSLREFRFWYAIFRSKAALHAQGLTNLKLSIMFAVTGCQLNLYSLPTYAT